ncbi:MAG: hypothetical protein E6H84_03905 [Chloroflexi bacterium]|nr:MAG: hypothetical protein E6H84_03905 [Chloroflexota bacterium]TMG72350.1 MAG: hypothetical protein E6H81_00055 [Chloroflexota bacterium]
MSARSRSDERSPHGAMEECPDCGSVTFRGAWAIDGARTLPEAALMFREYADEIEDLAAAGYVLRDPIQHDLGYALRPEDGEEDE